MRFTPISKVFCGVLAWRLLLLAGTAQPIPANDAFGYDGAVVNFLRGGGYCNPSLALIFPISGAQVYSGYPPLYEGVLLVWMKLFGASVISAMALHLMLFAVAGWLVLAIIRSYFPSEARAGIAALLFFGLTFDDRPDSLAYVFGLAALWLAGRQLAADRFRLSPAAGLALALLCGLYTSVIIGTYFFGAAFLACAVSLIGRQNFSRFLPFIAAGTLFLVITASIAKFEPLWWAGFQESARQQSVVSAGFHVPGALDLIRLLRVAPVFVLGFLVIPPLAGGRRELGSPAPPWLALTLGIFVMGWVLLLAAVSLLASTYVNFVVLTQVILAVGLLALVQKHRPGREEILRAAILLCAALVSIRALGMSTWGVACAWENSFLSAQRTLQKELKPFSGSDQPVLLSSAFLYSAAGLGVKESFHCDWYFDHAHWTNNAEIAGLIRLKPQKIILTQFDYYRGFAGPIASLQQHPELAEVQVRNLAGLPPPDSIPSLSRVIQHISWAPVIIDIKWKTSGSPSNAAPAAR